MPIAEQPPYGFDTSDSDEGRNFRATIMGLCVSEVGEILKNNVEPMPGFMLLMFHVDGSAETTLAANVPPLRILEILEWQTNRVKLMMADAQGKPS